MYKIYNLDNTLYRDQYNNKSNIKSIVISKYYVINTLVLVIILILNVFYVKFLSEYLTKKIFRIIIYIS